MEPKKIILCPNPDRDTGMKATKSAIAILRDMGFQTVVCSPFRDPRTDAFGDLPSKPLLPEWKGADLVITDCETCKWQIEMSTSLRCEHPITLLAQALA